MGEGEVVLVAFGERRIDTTYGDADVRAHMQALHFRDVEVLSVHARNCEGEHVGARREWRRDASRERIKYLFSRRLIVC